MKTWADVKRRLQVGVSLTMTHHSNFAGKIVGVPRKIAVVQSNAIKFEPHDTTSSGSWLTFPKSSEVEILDKDSFRVKFINGFMDYKFN